MKGLCETCMKDKMCANGEIQMTVFDIDFNEARDTVIKCTRYIKGEAI